MYCRKHSISSVFSTNRTLLTKLTNKTGSRKLPSLDDFNGSIIKKDGIEYLFVNPLSHIVKVPYGKFLLERNLSKFLKPEKWFPEINFEWEVLSATNWERVFNRYFSASIIAVDIETFKNPLSIRCIGYTAIFIDDNGNITSHSCVLPIDSEFSLTIMRRFNWELKAPKVLQNGKYDISYLSRYNAPLYNWCFDTINALHSWYSELPRDLGFIGAFFVRNAMYWKDLANTTDLQEYYYYNCKDTWTTAIAFLAWLMEAPDWAKKNYIMKFPVNFPSHLAEMTGIYRDPERLKSVRAEVDSIVATHQKKLNMMVGCELNVSSTPQMKRLCKVLGLGKTVGGIYIPVDSCDEKSLKKFSYGNHLNARIFGEVLAIRKQRKLKSTYLRLPNETGEDTEDGASEFNQRVLYAINPHGTDTGRNSSKEHHFWAGLNIQNIPRGKTIKSTLRADEGFLFGECDLEQAESRDVAHISGDEKLIANVTGNQDFHALNCSAFFGVPYGNIYDDSTRKVVNKELRDLAKRVNHGANYCMGANILVDTMGLDKIYEAAKLLKLSSKWSPVEIAEHLLTCFHKTYPSLEKVMYPAIWSEVLTTAKLVGATGWTRYCFSKPTQDNKHARNSYVAHVPQSLNAMVLDKAFIKVFIDIAMDEKHSRNFKLLSQIHDSILFQYRKGHDYLCEMVKERMEISISVRGYDGKERTFTVPAAIKKGGKYWSELE